MSFNSTSNYPLNCLVSPSERDLPVGFKQTEVGLLPEDWLVEPLENFTSFISYGFTNPMPTVFSGPYMITARDISASKIQYKGARNTSTEAFQKLLTAKSKPQKNDLLLTKDGTLGRLALVEDELICINQSVAILRPNHRIVPSFFLVLLESPYYQNRMIEDAGGSTIKHIYITIVNRMQLGVPSCLKEQTAIANALSDVDALIQELEKLIAKKQAIKTATMQQLLTGRTRLPQFALHPDGRQKGYKPSELGEIPEDWEVKTLSEISTMHGRIGWQGLKQEEFTFNDSQPFLITGMNFKDGKIRWNEVYHIAEDRYQMDKNIQLNIGDILMTKDGTIGKLLFVDHIPSPGKATLNSHLLVFRPKASTFFPSFLYYLMKTEVLDKHIEIHKSGSTFFGITQAAISKLKVCLPPLNEQISIAEVFTDIDDEIEFLDQRLAKTRQIKQGMMQELLTGKTRLVKPVGTA